MNSSKLINRTFFHQIRKLSLSRILMQEVQAATTHEPKITIPLPSDVIDKPVSAKIDKLCSDISQLNLIEVSELSGLLKRRLNLPDAPVMPTGGFVVGGAAQREEEEDVSPVKTKSAFTVKLMKFDEKQKVALIKEIKALMEGFNLVQAKKFVESAPVIVKADLGKDDAENLKEALVKVGAEVEIE